MELVCTIYTYFNWLWGFQWEIDCATDLSGGGTIWLCGPGVLLYILFLIHKLNNPLLFRRIQNNLQSNGNYILFESVSFNVQFRYFGHAKRGQVCVGLAPAPYRDRQTLHVFLFRNFKVKVKKI